MTIDDIIRALRHCLERGGNKDCRIWCPYVDQSCGACAPEQMLYDAANALECASAEKRIAALEESIEGYKVRIAELEAQLPKEGEWIDLLFGRDYKCSVCGEWYRMDGTPEQEDMNYCPNCGAKMKIGEDK